MKGLYDRLADWGTKVGHFHLSLSIVIPPNMQFGQVAATLGAVTGYGRTTNEALNNLADGLVEEGWPDDRVSCHRCEGDGSYSELADCTTMDGNCACNGARVLVDPCPKCDGTGMAGSHSTPEEDR